MSAAGTAAIAVASSAAAQAAAARETARCHGVIQRYEATNPTVEQARDYAGCIYRIHGSGEPLDPSATLLLKIAILLILVSVPVGSWIVGRHDRDIFGYLLGAITAPVLVAFTMFCLWLVAAGITFIAA